MREVQLGSGNGGLTGGGGEFLGNRESCIASWASEAKPWWNGRDQTRFYTKKWHYHLGAL